MFSKIPFLNVSENICSQGRSGRKIFYVNERRGNGNMSNGLKDGGRKITKIKEDLDKEKALSEKKKKKKDLEVMRRMKKCNK